MRLPFFNRDEHAHATTETLIRFLDSELPPETHRQVFEHLGACERCSAELDELRTLLADVLPAAAPTPEELSVMLSCINERIEAYRSRSEQGDEQALTFVQEIGYYLGRKAADAARRAGRVEDILPEIHPMLSVFLGRKATAELENRLLRTTE